MVSQIFLYVPMFRLNDRDKERKCWNSVFAFVLVLVCNAAFCFIERCLFGLIQPAIHDEVSCTRVYLKYRHGEKTALVSGKTGTTIRLGVSSFI